MKIFGPITTLNHLSLKTKVIVALVLIVIGFGLYQFVFKSKNLSPTYETQAAEKGTLITTISGSGTITSGNNDNISTKVSGTVAKTFVQNGDTVTKGQTIAEIALDEYALERQTAAWVSYLEATEAVKTAKAQKITADIDMWQARQDILDAEEAIDYKNINSINPATHEEYTLSEKTIIDKSLEKAQLSYEAAETKYKNADADISNAQAKVSAAYRNYLENSAKIVAPSAGIISDLSLAPGLIVNANSSTSTQNGSTIITSQTIGKITHPKGQLIATVNLSEIDILSVKANQKVTLTLDAYENQTFSGSVLSINTTGSANSGVVSYPVTILLDPVSVDIYPNMAVNVDIITNIKTDVLLIPSSALTVTDNLSTVKVKKGNQEIAVVAVETGLANDTQTEILSGLNPGDLVVTATINPSTTNHSNNSNTSPFSGLGRTGTSSTRNSGGSNLMQMGGPPPGGGF